MGVPLLENMPLSRCAHELAEGQLQLMNTLLQASAGVTSTSSFRSASNTPGST